MKKILAIILICSPVFAIKTRLLTATAQAPIPTSYSTGSQSRLVSEVGYSNKNLILVTTAADIVCHLGEKNHNVVPTSNDKEVHLIQNVPMEFKDIGGIPNIFCKSTASEKTSGWIEAILY